MVREAGINMMRVYHSSEVGPVDRTLLVDSLASSSNEIRLFACEQRLSMESVGMLGFVNPQSWWLGSAVSLPLRRRGSRKESGYLVFPHRTLGGWTGSPLRALPALGCGASYSITSVGTPK